MSGGFGSGTNIFGNTAPGTVDPFSFGALSFGTTNAMDAMHNRYTQLGLGTPSGGSPASAAASGGNLSYGGPGTAEQMDLGQLPSLVGGIPGMAAGALGEEQTNALNQPSGGSGGGGKGGGLGGLASLGGLGLK